MHFHTYPPTSSYLGGVVESLVKQVKFMFHSSIAKNILSYDHFYLLVGEINMLINKRPIAFKPLLNNPDIDPETPSMLSPEILLKGYDVPNMVIAPHLHIKESTGDDPDWVLNQNSDQEKLYNRYKKFRKVKSRFRDLYHSEFLGNLREMSTNRADRYRAVNHTKLKINDIVAIWHKFSKPYFFPLGVVQGVRENELGEVVEASIKKANGEVVRRHIENLILIKSE